MIQVSSSRVFETFKYYNNSWFPISQANGPINKIVILVYINIYICINVEWEREIYRAYDHLWVMCGSDISRLDWLIFGLQLLHTNLTSTGQAYQTRVWFSMKLINAAYLLSIPTFEPWISKWMTSPSYGEDLVSGIRLGLRGHFTYLSVELLNTWFSIKTTP